MKEYVAVEFFQLIERHADTIMEIESLRLRAKDRLGSLSDELDEAMARERQARGALLGWKPVLRIEAQLKFLYVVHHLICTRGSLDDQEMQKLHDSIAHLR